MRRRWGGPWVLDRRNNIWRRPLQESWPTAVSTNTLGTADLIYTNSASTAYQVRFISAGFFSRWIDGPKVKPRKSLSATSETAS